MMTDDIEGVVDDTPCAEGDSWVLRVNYVQRFETMILLYKPNIRLDGSHINPLRRLDQQAEAGERRLIMSDNAKPASGCTSPSSCWASRRPGQQNNKREEMQK